MSHTPEPWHTRTQCPGECCWHLYNGQLHGADGDAAISCPEISNEDAARIVACVNYCAGMPTAELLHTRLLTLLDTAGNAQSDRDALAAALRAVLPMAEEWSFGGPDYDAITNYARAVLAKVTP